jgi:hypothetical protein
VSESNRPGADETLLLRARYIQLIQALHRTRECNPATLAALLRVIPVKHLAGFVQDKSLEQSSSSTSIAA